MVGGIRPRTAERGFSPSRARFIPAGSKFVFQQHYTPTGSEQTDITKVGLIFADESEVTEQLQTFMAIDRKFEIKPNDPNHVVHVRLKKIPKNGKLLNISPHMHFRGKSFTAKVKRKSGGDSEILLNVPQYDFNWQHIYQLKEPLPLSDVGSISAEIVFDNSAKNPFNPDPEKHVTWGDQTWEEMAIGFFDVSIPRKPKASKAEKSPSLIEAEVATERTKQVALQAKIDSTVADFFKRFDANNDRIITRDELPLALQSKRGYSRFNTDGEPGLSVAEIAEQARQRFEKHD